MNLKDRVNFIVKFCGMYLGHSNMIDERHQDIFFNVHLPEEEEIANCIDEVSVILLTGEAGDGKSRLIRNLAPLFKDNGFKVIPDFSAKNEEDRKEIVLEIAKLFSNENNISEKYVIAANIGIFTQTFLKYCDEELEKFRYINKIKIINFQKRNLAEPKGMLFNTIIKHFIEYDDSCFEKSCSLLDNCPFKNNIDSLNNNNVIENIRVLCDTLYLTGGHLTFRELLSFISFMITGGEDCSSISNAEYAKNIKYFNIFDKKDDILLKKFSVMDPARKSVEGDLQIYSSCGNDLNQFIEEKRRCYFEEKHEDAYKLLPINYLVEFKKTIDELHKHPYYIMAIESTGVFADIKKGLIKLISPQETDLEMSFFDTPAKISKDIRTKFSVDINSINLIWNRSDFEFNAFQLKESFNNSFCLSCVFSSDEYVYLPIDYNLFMYIMSAKDEVYLDAKNETMDKFGVSNFFRTVLRRNYQAYKKMTVIFNDNNDRNVDFELTKFEQKLLFSDNTEVKVLIKKMNGGTL